MRKYILALANKLVGVPYIWGGCSPNVGFDCSGFVIWIFQVFDVLPSGDWVAHDLWKKYTQTDKPLIGDLVFYGTKKRITHVMMFAGVTDGTEMCVGATGGGSETTTVEEARKRNAMVKLKPVLYRNDFVGYGSIGIS
jgi:hypothetical protein